MLKSIRRCNSALAALFCLTAPLGVVINACGGASEAAPPPAAPEAPAAAAAGDDTTAVAATEPEPSTATESTTAEASSEAQRASSEAAPAPEAREQAKPASDTAASNQLAAELEKRRKVAKAQAGDDEPEPEPAAPAEAEPGGPTYQGPDPCRAKSFELERVREACASGGRAAAKRIMRDVVTKAIAMSHKLVCADCHVNQNDYTLKPNAEEELKRWLEGS